MTRSFILTAVMSSVLVPAGCSQNSGGTCPLSGGGGWTALFNGKDTAGWVELGSTGAWSVEEGTLTCNGKKTGYAWLCTEKKYGNFILEVEYRIGEKGNSGVFCLVPKRKGRASMEGFEAQITDRTEGPRDEHSPGSIFQRAVANSHPGKPPGTWNKMRITCKGNDITIAINGTTVVEIDKSKIDNMKNVPDEGYIGLQNHGSAIDFRTVRIKML